MVNTFPDFEHPSVLVENQRYFLKLSSHAGAIPIFTPITFISFTGCTAVIVVADGRNNRFPCMRGELFDLVCQDNATE